MHNNLLLDLDQTLLDFHASENIALGKVLQENGLSYSDEIYALFKAYNKSLWGELEKGNITRTELFTLRFNYIFGKCEGDSTGIDPLKINSDFIRTMSENGVLLEGALEFLQRVKNEIENVRIYIITNGATINAKGRIASTGLDKYIDSLFVSEDMGVNKPSAEFFDMVLKKIEEPKEKCIVIGDSLSSDMLGAKNASMTSVWFRPEGDMEKEINAYDIDYTVSSYDELFRVIKDWTSFKEIETKIKMVPYEEKLKDSVFAFTEKCFEELGKKFEPDGRHSFYNDIEGYFEVFFCLTVGDRVAGTVAVKRLDDHTAELKALYLSKELRGRGYGKKLLDEAVGSAMKLGFKSIVLDSMSKYKEALRLYEKAGFKYIERYNDNQYADVFMRLEL